MALRKHHFSILKVKKFFLQLTGQLIANRAGNGNTPLSLKALNYYLGFHLLICLGWLSSQERNSMTLRVPPRCVATTSGQSQISQHCPTRSDSGPFCFFIWGGGANLPSPVYNIRYTSAQIRINDSHSKIANK